MAHNVVLPQWGMEMSDGTIVKWLKMEGDYISKGEPLVEIETAKISSELEAPSDGVLACIFVVEGATVDVGTILAIIGELGEEVVVPDTNRLVLPTPATISVSQVSVPEVESTSRQVEPVARRLAKEKGIDLGSVRGTGLKGRVTVEDVELASTGVGQVPSSPSISEGTVELTGMRRAIAERMLRSSQEMAAVTLSKEVDVTSLVSATQRLRGKGVGRLPLVVKAVAASLKEHPLLNAHLWGFHVRRVSEVNIGVAVAVEQGLVVPVVRHADGKSVDEIAQEVRHLATKARKGQLSYNDVTEGTFTISTLGPQGVDVFTPLINPPEVAILGIGRIKEKPAIYKGEIAKRSMMWLSLTFDHRVCDGKPAAQFLGSISRRLEDTVVHDPA